jgi:hypothetical protein
MEWAITEEGKTGRDSILVILDEHHTAEDMARELRFRGQRVDVRPYKEARTSRARTRHADHIPVGARPGPSALPTHDTASKPVIK